MKTTNYILDGEVQCPRKGTIDIDQCAGCPDLVSIKHTGKGDVMTCSVPSTWYSVAASLPFG